MKTLNQIDFLKKLTKEVIEQYTYKIDCDGCGKLYSLQSSEIGYETGNIAKKMLLREIYSLGWRWCNIYSGNHYDHINGLFCDECIKEDKRLHNFGHSNRMGEKLIKKN